MTILDELVAVVVGGNPRRARDLAGRAVREGLRPQQVIDQAIVPAMALAGEKFKRDDFYLPEVLLSARAAHEVLRVLKPLLTADEARPLARVVIGTVRGDMHDVGKNLVAMMLEGAGFAVADLGLDVPPERFVAAVRAGEAEIVCLSSLVTTTMASMRQTIQALEAAGLRDRVKVLVGGAPVTQRFADEIGADGYAPDAARAVDLARGLVSGSA